jgi:esterase/lipase superfamily enzyme
MATNRRIIHGKYSNEEKPNKKFEYQYDYDHQERGKDGFNKRGEVGFKLSLIKELQRLRNEEEVNTPKVGIYIHGYNNNYQASIDEIFDFEKNLADVIEYKPIIVGFSWPSRGRVPDYLSDREEVRDSVGAFTRFLCEINTFITENERECFSTSYCVAHSMGNYLLRKGMEYLSDYLGAPGGRLLFNETIMLAPDLASKDIELDGKGSYIADFSRRVHVYYSTHDRALKASSLKRFGANRLGRHGANDYSNLADNVVLVNAEKYANSSSADGLKDRENKQVSVHSSHRYHPNILKDISQVLSSVERNLISNREPIITSEYPEDSLINHYKIV